MQTQVQEGRRVLVFSKLGADVIFDERHDSVPIVNVFLEPSLPATGSIEVEQITGAGGIQDNETFTILDTFGTSHEFTFTTSNDDTAGNVIGVQTAQATGGTPGKTLGAIQIATAIGEGTTADLISALQSDASVALEQDIDGEDGNTLSIDSVTGVTVSHFSGGSGPEGGTRGSVTVFLTYVNQTGCGVGFSNRFSGYLHLQAFSSVVP